MTSILPLVNPSCPLLRQTISSRSEGCLKPSPNREDNNGRYHNHHLLLVRRLLEGLGAPTRPTSPLVHRRGDDHPPGGRRLLRRERGAGPPVPARVRLRAHRDQQESLQP